MAFPFYSKSITSINQLAFLREVLLGHVVKCFIYVGFRLPVFLLWIFVLIFIRCIGL